MIYDIFVLAHVITFAYWLGTGLAGWQLARIKNPEHIRKQVEFATSSQGALFDVIPRICMPMTLATGVTLAVLKPGSELSILWVGIVWPLSFIWLLMLLLQHMNRTLPLMVNRVSYIDAGLRLALLAVILGYGIFSLWGQTHPALPLWLGLKVIIFGIIMAVGLVIRFVMRPMPMLMGRVNTSTNTAEDVDEIERITGHALKGVALIWVLLVAAAALGISQPV